MKRTKTRLLSTLLTLAMVLTLIPAMGTTAFAAEIISNANAIVTEPVVGAHPSFTATSSDPSKYSVELLYWSYYESIKEVRVEPKDASTFTFASN